MRTAPSGARFSLGAINAPGDVFHRQTFTVEPGSPIDPTNSSSVANESRTSKSRGLRIARIRAGCAFAVLGRRHPKKAWRLPVQVQNTHELLFGLIQQSEPAGACPFVRAPIHIGSNEIAAHANDLAPQVSSANLIRSFLARGVLMLWHGIHNHRAACDHN